MLRRLKFLGWTFSLCFFGLLCKLGAMQLLKQPVLPNVDLSQKAKEIHQNEVVVDSGRGIIFDRFKRPLIGEKCLRLFAFPQTKERLKLRSAKIKTLARILAVAPEALQGVLQTLIRPAFITQIAKKPIKVTEKDGKEIAALKIPGLQVYMGDNRNEPTTAAAQLVGFIRPIKSKDVDGQPGYIGATGLEHAFDHFLQGKQGKFFSYVTDRRMQPLVGITPELKSFQAMEKKPVDIVTTIDSKLQANIEDILTKEEVVNGAVVVQEVASGDILALASRPNKRRTASDYDVWQNVALLQATPGSIFKIVVAVAALEEGLVNLDTPMARCSGEWEKYHLHDADFKVHGEQTFAMAFANSCNVVFAKLAAKLGGTKLKEYAERLGLGQKVVFEGQLLEEDPGQLFLSSNLQEDEGVVAQSGIGQRDVQLTPLQATNMITTLFHNGQTVRPRLVTDILAEPPWKFVKSLAKKQIGLRTSTIAALKKMLHLVATHGTGKKVDRADLGVKTGTAQVGVDNKSYHRWIVGFMPYRRPRYTLCALVKGTSDDKDQRVTRIFRQVTDLLLER